MSQMPAISVIVVNWNGMRFLETCLSALRRQTFCDFETILVDNGSTDGSTEYVRVRFPEVKVVALAENRGFTGGNIVGWEHSRGDLIVLLNNDTEADPNWLEELNKASLEFPNAGSFASKMLHFDNRQRIDNCGFAVTLAGLTVDLGRDELDGPEWTETRKVFGACGGAGAYRRRMLEDIGFLDDDFFVIYEDVDLSFRARLMGYECAFVPRAIVYHHLGATRRNYPAWQVFFSQRNIEFVYLKNLPIGLMLRSLPQRLIYELGGALYFFKMGVGVAFVKSKVHGVRCIPGLLRKRKHIQRRKVLTNRELQKLMHRGWLGAKWKRLLSAWRTVRSPLQASQASSPERTESL